MLFRGITSIIAGSRRPNSGIRRKVPRIESDYSLVDYTMESASLADYLQAKSVLIRLLENIRSATVGKDFAEVVWNGMKLCEQGVIFQAEGHEADYFTAAFRKAFRIEREKDRITVTAPNAEGLRKAADNWIRTMDPAGIWF